MGDVDVKKILLFDLSNDGHHWFYNSNIMSQIKNKYNLTYYTTKLDDDKIDFLVKNNIKFEQVNLQISSNKIKRMIQIFNIFIKLKKYIKKHKFDLVMFLYLDSHILQMIVFLFSNLKIISTLHWLPKSFLKKLILKCYLKNNNKYLVVHDELIRDNLTDNNNSNVKVIYYPITENLIYKKVDKKILPINDNLVTLLAFGGTRYDKGLDILLDSLRFIKYPINLIIAGKEETFKREFIEEKLTLIQKSKINCILDLNYISDEKMHQYFSITDIVVLPYRKMFMGQSGPMTEGIKNGCVIVAPDWFILGQTVKKYNCGLLYEPENPQALANAINKAIENIEELKRISKINSEKFIKERNISNFRQAYEKLIENILG
jgi:glycosyltransferase involved in cell wall biosynthesis